MILNGQNIFTTVEKTYESILQIKFKDTQMKNWKQPYRVAFIVTVIVFIIGVIVAILNGPEYGIALGIVCLLGALLCFVISLIAFIASYKENGKGLLLSAGILLLLSGISCGLGFSI